MSGTGGPERQGAHARRAEGRGRRPRAARLSADAGRGRRKQEPNFTGLMAAYDGAGTGDWNVVFQHKAEPGDTILVHAGLYKGDRHNYVDPHEHAVRRRAIS